MPQKTSALSVRQQIEECEKYAEEPLTLLARIPDKANIRENVFADLRNLRLIVDKTSDGNVKTLEAVSALAKSLRAAVSSVSAISDPASLTMDESRIRILAVQNERIENLAQEEARIRVEIRVLLGKI